MRIRLLIFLFLAASAASVEASLLGALGVRITELSPDGEHLAVLIRDPARDRLVVISSAGNRTAASIQRSAPNRIGSVLWIDSRQLAITEVHAGELEIPKARPGRISILTMDGTQEPLETLTGDPSNGLGALSVVHGLPARAGVLLIADVFKRELRIEDLGPGSASAMPFPDLRDLTFVASPGADYVVASGVDADGEPRVQFLEPGESKAWVELDQDLRPVSISDSGVAYAYRFNSEGIQQLVAVRLLSTSSRTLGRMRSDVAVLFADSLHDAGDLMLDSAGEPFAVRFEPGYPSWNYLGNRRALISLHKAYRAALPKADLVFVSASMNDHRIVAEARFDDRPREYYLIATQPGAKARRVLASPEYLHTLGGEMAVDYHVEPFEFLSASNVRIFGFVSKPVNEPDQLRPAVMVLRERPFESRWQWGFNEEVRLLNRLGFNVLLVNHRGSPGYGLGHASADLAEAARDMRDTMAWAIGNKLAEPGMICLVGLGQGGVALASLVAAGAPEVDCLFKAEQSATGKTASMSLLDLVSEQARMVRYLDTRAPARKHKLPLPLTPQQSDLVGKILANYARMSDEVGPDQDAAKSWLREQQGRVRDALREEQWLIYQALISDDLEQGQLIAGQRAGALAQSIR